MINRIIQISIFSLIIFLSFGYLNADSKIEADSLLAVYTDSIDEFTVYDDYNAALNYVRKAELSDSKSDSLWARMYTYSGLLYLEIGSFDTAFTFFSKAWVLYNSNDNRDYKAFVNNYIGIMLKRSGYYEKAFEYTQNAINYMDTLQLCTKTPSCWYLIQCTIVLHINHGEILEKLGKFDSAHFHYSKAWKLIRRHRMFFFKYLLRAKEARLEMARGNLEAAENQLKTIIREYQSYPEFRRYMAYYIRSLAEVLFVKKEYHNSISLLDKAQHEYGDDSRLYDKMICLQYKYKNYEALGNTDSACLYMKQYHIQRESFYKINILQRVSHFESKNAIDALQSELEGIERKHGALGIKFDFLATAFVLGGLGIIVFIYIAIRRRRNLESLNKRLEQRITAKNKLFAIISHDIKSPFAANKQMIDLLDENYRSLPDTKKQRYVRDIKVSTDRVYHLIENLLTWARLQLDKADFVPVRIDIHEIMEREIDNISMASLFKSLEMVQETHGPLYVYADKDMVSFVVRNLICNAVKYTGEMGRIESSAIRKDSDVIITVRDNGVGMSDKELEALFDPSVLLTKPGTHGEKGGGMGLLLSKEFVEKNWGNMIVKSAEGAGSVFSFTLKAFEEKKETKDNT